MAINAYKGLDPTKLDQAEYIKKYDKLKAKLKAKHPDWSSRRINKHIYSMKDMGFPHWNTKTKKAAEFGAEGAESFHIRAGAKGKPSVPDSESKTARRNARDNPKRQARVKGNQPWDEVGIEAGKQWDELVGAPDKTFTIGDKTFKHKNHYVNWEISEKKRLNKLKEEANKLGGKTHGHALPTTHPGAVESHFQSFPEDPTDNFSSQNKLPKDIDARLKTSQIPVGKKAVAQRFVGTAERIGDPLPDTEIERILKSTDFDGTVQFQPKRPPRGYFKDGLDMVGKIGKSKAAKLTGKAVWGLGLGLSIAGAVDGVQAATRDPSAKNYAKLGLRGIDLGLEIVDTFTMGLSTPLTLLAQAGLMTAEEYIDGNIGRVSKAAQKEQIKQQTEGGLYDFTTM